METAVEKAKIYLDERRGERVTLEELARAVGASPFHLQRRFKQAFGISPRDYQDAHRLEAVKSSLKNGSRVTEALFDAGYGSTSRFYEKAASIRGTVFQRRVWRALSRIPRGETRTYAQIARAIGNPAAVRAVGSACGANPVALVVPCHRAVRTDGGLGGYAWGIARKKRLLELEKPTKK